MLCAVRTPLLSTVSLYASFFLLEYLSLSLSLSLSGLLSVLLDPSSLFDRICRSFELLLHFCSKLGLSCLHSGGIIRLSIILEIRLQVQRWFPIWDMKLFVIRSENLRGGLWQWYSSRFLSYPVWEDVELRNVLLKTYRILIEEFVAIFKLYLLEEKERYVAVFDKPNTATRH